MQSNEDVDQARRGPAAHCVNIAKIQAPTARLRLMVGVEISVKIDRIDA